MLGFHRLRMRVMLVSVGFTTTPKKGGVGYRRERDVRTRVRYLACVHNTDGRQHEKGQQQQSTHRVARVVAFEGLQICAGVAQALENHSSFLRVILGRVVTGTVGRQRLPSLLLGVKLQGVSRPVHEDLRCVGCDRFAATSIRGAVAAQIRGVARSSVVVQVRPSS